MIIPSKKNAVILVSVILVSLYFLNSGHMYAQNATNSTAGAVGGAAKNATNSTAGSTATKPTFAVDPVPLLAIIGLIMVIPMIIDMVMAYLKKPAQNGQAPVGLPLALHGLYRTLMTFGIVLLVGTVIFYLLNLDLTNPTSVANETLRNLSTILGTALATIIAFYFGIRGTTTAVEKAAQAISGTQKPPSSEEEKLTSLNVQAILDKYPETQHPKKVKLADQIKDVLATFSGATDVLVVDNDDKPVGVLYKSELLSVLGELTPQGTLKVEDNTNLAAKIGAINDHLVIPGKKWFLNGKAVPSGTTAENSTIANFATVTADDNLFHAKEMMAAISNQINVVLCVVILDRTSSKVKAMFGYDSILGFVKS